MGNINWIEIAIALTSIYGAILSTLVFMWQYRSSRPTLVLHTVEEFYRQRESDVSTLEAAVVTATNNGQQPQAISYIGFMYKRLFRKPKFILVTSVANHAHAYKLDPGQSVEKRFKAASLAAELDRQGIKRNVKLSTYVLTPDRKRFEGPRRSFTLSQIRP